MMDSENLFYMKDKVGRYTIITVRALNTNIYRTGLYDDETCLHERMQSKTSTTRDEALNYHNNLVSEIMTR